MKLVYKIVLIIVVVAGLLGAGAYWYAFMRPHLNMETANAQFKLSSSALFNEFSNDETAANEKYLGKVVEVNGEVVAVNESGNQTAIILDDPLFGISAYLDSSYVADNRKIIETIEAGQNIIIRAQCDGMLTDVVISRGVIVR